MRPFDAMGRRETVALHEPGSNERGSTYGGRMPTLEQVFVDHADYVWNTFRRLGVVGADIQDLTQDLFVTLQRLLPDYDPSRPIRPWLFVMAYRMAARHQQRGRRELATDTITEAPDSSADLDKKMAASQDRELIVRALDAIELHRRAVFVMAEIDETPIPEIAANLGIPLNTAYSRLRLARDEFRAAVIRLSKQERR